MTNKMKVFIGALIVLVLTGWTYVYHLKSVAAQDKSAPEKGVASNELSQATSTNELAGQTSTNTAQQITVTNDVTASEMPFSIKGNKNKIKITVDHGGVFTIYNGPLTINPPPIIVGPTTEKIICVKAPERSTVPPPDNQAKTKDEPAYEGSREQAAPVQQQSRPPAEEQVLVVPGPYYYYEPYVNGWFGWPQAHGPYSGWYGPNRLPQNEWRGDRSQPERHNDERPGWRGGGNQPNQGGQGQGGHLNGGRK